MDTRETVVPPKGQEYESNLYEDRAKAEEALQRLQAIGYGPDRISLIVGERDLPTDQGFESDTSPLAEHGGMGETGEAAGIASGALLGALIGGAAAPFVIGPLAVALTAGLGTGIVFGSIVGALLELGIEAHDWRVGLQRGGIALVVTLKSHADRAAVRRALMHPSVSRP